MIECKKGRVPPAYFPPTNFVKDAFQKDESVFFLRFCENLKFFHIWKISIFLQKNLTIQ